MITIKGIYGREMFETWYAMSAMLRSGLDISASSPTGSPAADWAEAFATARGGQCGKVVLDWSGGLSVRSGARRSCARRSTRSARRALQARAPAGLAAVGARAGPAARDVLNFCANNYLGLADHPDVVAAARGGAGRVGLRHGQRALHLRHADPAHRSWSQRLSQFLGTEATILFSSCFDANGGVFEVLLDERDAVISDELNHASIIDGIRLCKAHAAALPQPRHGRPRGPAQRGGRRAAAARRHRRRVLDGRLPRPARRDLRRSPSSTTRW